MSHVHWWLFGLSFATGLVLTLALLVGSAKHQAPVRVSADESAEAESPTTKIPVVTEQPTTRIPVVTEQPTTEIPVADSPTTKIPVVTEQPTTQIPLLPPAPHGPGSARATPEGGGPPGWLVKGRSDTRLYYTPDDPAYDQTVAQVWFKDEESAARANFTRWRKSSRK